MQLSKHVFVKCSILSKILVMMSVNLTEINCIFMTFDRVNGGFVVQPHGDGKCWR